MGLECTIVPRENHLAKGDERGWVEYRIRAQNLNGVDLKML